MNRWMILYPLSRAGESLSNDEILAAGGNAFADGFLPAAPKTPAEAAAALEDAGVMSVRGTRPVDVPDLQDD